MAQLDAKPIIDGEVDSHLEHLRRPLPCSAILSKPLLAMPDPWLTAQAYLNFQNAACHMSIKVTIP